GRGAGRRGGGGGVSRLRDLRAQRRSVSTGLDVRDLSVDYDGIAGLRALSLSVGKGELVGLFGANGAGKSTALKAIMGLVVPSAGRVVVAGEDVTGRPAHIVARRGVALVPEGR